MYVVGERAGQRKLLSATLPFRKIRFSAGPSNLALLVHSPDVSSTVRFSASSPPTSFNLITAIPSESIVFAYSDGDLRVHPGLTAMTGMILRVAQYRYCLPYRY